MQSNSDVHEWHVQGLPFAGPTTKRDSSGVIWAMREAWTFEDYCLNYRQARLVDTKARLAHECELRYGSQPEQVPRKQPGQLRTKRRFGLHLMSNRPTLNPLR
jgi:hypothetical protein